MIEAKLPELAIGVEADDPRMNAGFMKDERLKGQMTGSAGFM